MAKTHCLLLTFAAILGAQNQGSVTGSVTNSLTHEPVKRAMIRMQGMNAQESAALTDEEGKFQFAGVKPGGYTVSAEAQGYTRRVLRAVTVAAGQNVTGVAMALKPGGIISGKVLDSDGEPMPEIPVRAMTYVYEAGVRKLALVAVASTNDRGEYRIASLVPRRYYVVCDGPPAKPEPRGRVHRPEPEMAYAQAYYPNAPDAAGAAPVNVTAGAETGGIDIRQQKVRLFHVRGKVTGGPGMAVTLTRCDSPDAVGAESILPEGGFDLGPAAPGSYCVTAAGALGVARQEIRIADKDVEGLALTPGAAFALRGTVSVEGPARHPLDAFRLLLTPAAMEARFRDAPVSAAGLFRVDGVLPLTYTVGVQMSSELYVKSIRLGGQEAEEARIQFASGAEPLTVIVAADAGQVAGTVRTAAGNPVAAMVAVVPAGTPFRFDRIRTGNSDEKGRFTVTGVPPGDYQVIALEELDMTAIASPDYRKALQAKIAGVTIPPNGRATADLVLLTADETADALEKVQ